MLCKYLSNVKQSGGQLGIRQAFHLRPFQAISRESPVSKHRAYTFYFVYLLAVLQQLLWLAKCSDKLTIERTVSVYIEDFMVE